MTRMSKPAERRGRCPRKRKPAGIKTGPKKDNLPKGYKENENALEGTLAGYGYISKAK